LGWETDVLLLLRGNPWGDTTKQKTQQEETTREGGLREETWHMLEKLHTAL